MSDAAASVTNAPAVTETPASDAANPAGIKADTTAPPNGAAPPPPAALPARYKFDDLKVDGKAASKEYTHDELKAILQKHSSADQRLAQVAEEKKAISAALQRLREDPFAALKDPALGGIDLEELAIKRLSEKFQQEELQKSDPAAAERMRMQTELDARNKEIEAFKMQQQQAADAQMFQQVQQETLTTYQAALQKLGVPPDDEIVTLMLDLNLKSLDYGLDLTAEQLALAAREHLEGRSKSIVEKERGRWGSLDGEGLLKDLGEDVTRKVQAALLARARALVGRPAVPVEQKPFETEDTAPRRKFEPENVIKRRMGIVF